MEKSKHRNIFGRYLALIRRKLRTRRGRNVMLYLMCLVAATLFWFIISLDEITERDFEIPVRLTNVPDSVVIVGEVPTSLNVMLKGRGTQFIRYRFGELPTLEIDFRQYNAKSRVLLTRSKLDSKLRDMFGQSIGILLVNPDSISIGYTSGKGYRLPLRIDAEVSAGASSILSGRINASVDSVSVYTVGDLPPSVSFIETERLVRDNLTDTTVCELRLKPIAGMQMRPASVKVTVPVEPLVSKRVMMPVKVKNVPDNQQLVIYPARVELCYLVPKHLADVELPVEVSVDYRSIHDSSNNVKVDVGDLPVGYRFVSVSNDSVKYVIER